MAETLSRPDPASLAAFAVPVNGVRTRYLVNGNGPPLLLVHGLLGHSFSWRFALPALASTARLYALDMPGAGYSDCPADLDASLPAAARRLLDFAGAVGLDRFDLLGTSYGGAVAMMAAAQAPHRVRSLILVAPVNPWSAHGRLLSRFLGSPPVSALFPRLAPAFTIAHDRVLRRLFADPRRIPPDSLAGYSAPYCRPGALVHPLRILRGWNAGLLDLRQALPRIAEIPALLIWGSEDRAVDPASALPLARVFRQASLHVIPGVGHLPYEESPDAFHPLVRDFLARQTDARPNL